MQELHVKSLLPVRLDKYLMEQFPALGLGRLNKALRENKIKLTSGGLPYMASPLIATADDEARQEYLAPIESLQWEYLSVKWEI